MKNLKYYVVLGSQRLGSCLVSTNFVTAEIRSKPFCRKSNEIWSIQATSSRHDFFAVHFSAVRFDIKIYILLDIVHAFMVMYSRTAQNKQATAAREKGVQTWSPLGSFHVTFCDIVYLIKVRSHSEFINVTCSHSL